MSPRLSTLNITHWLWFILALAAGPGCLAVAVTTRPSPADGPALVEAQAKFFQDFFSVQLSPYKLEFGHVCEDPNTWEQRYEHKDLKNFRDMGKVRWGDKQGGYGEHYWDLNHAGSTNNQATADHNDDQSKDHEYKDDHDYKDNHEYKDYTPDPNDPYDATVETGSYNPNYGDEYDAEKFAKSDPFEENSRAKRAHVRTKAEKRIYRSTEDEDEDSSRYTKSKESDEDDIDKELDDVISEEIQKSNPKKARKSNRQHKPAIKELNLDEDPEEEEVTAKPKRKTQKNEDSPNKEEPKAKESSKPQRSPHESRTITDNFPLRQGRTVYNPYRADVQRINDNYGTRNLQNHYVPYEDPGLRHQADTSVAASAAFRLYLEPSTGHVIDRATGLAYVLQPLVPNNNFDNYN